MDELATSPRARILYLSHGGGPLPLLGDAGHQEMVNKLQAIAATLKKPSAIIVISAHWEERQATITSSAHPALIYDYYGFPKESYDIEYPAPGNPDLAREVSSLLKAKNIEAVLDAKRGFDHGLFVPLKIMYPQADIPCLQVSLVKGLDPMTHINIGEAMAGLESNNLLVIGSGFSFHNMKAFFTPGTRESQLQNASFEDWLIDTCSNPELDETERTSRLVNWDKAPAARYCHPREEHLLPLHVCYGLAKRPCHAVFDLTILGKKASMYLW
jgi:4,5-DOPA dioxygenase extradiol